MKIIVGCIVLKDNSFVIVKEKQEHVYGKWNLPLGHLEEGEDIITGTKRESEEETGLKLDINGFVGVYQSYNKDGESIIKIIFKATTKDKKLNFQKDELLDAKWVTFEDFEKIPKEDIRVRDIIDAVKDYKNRGALSIDYIKNLK